VGGEAERDPGEAVHDERRERRVRCEVGVHVRHALLPHEVGEVHGLREDADGPGEEVRAPPGLAEDRGGQFRVTDRLLAQEPPVGPHDGRRDEGMIVRAADPRVHLGVHDRLPLAQQRVQLHGDPLLGARRHLVEDEGLAQLREARHDVRHPGRPLLPRLDRSGRRGMRPPTAAVPPPVEGRPGGGHSQAEDRPGRPARDPDAAQPQPVVPGEPVVAVEARQRQLEAFLAHHLDDAVVVVAEGIGEYRRAAADFAPHVGRRLPDLFPRLLGGELRQGRVRAGMGPDGRAVSRECAQFVPAQDLVGGRLLPPQLPAPPVHHPHRLSVRRPLDDPLQAADRCAPLRHGAEGQPSGGSLQRLPPRAFDRGVQAVPPERPGGVAGERTWHEDRGRQLVPAEDRPRHLAEVPAAVVEGDENRACGKGAAAADALERLVQRQGPVATGDLPHLLVEGRRRGADHRRAAGGGAPGIENAVIHEDAEGTSHLVVSPTAARRFPPRPSALGRGSRSRDVTTWSAALPRATRSQK